MCIFFCYFILFATVLIIFCISVAGYMEHLAVRATSEISERNEKSRVETLSSVFHILPPIIISSIKVFTQPTQSNNIHSTHQCASKSGWTLDFEMFLWFEVPPCHRSEQSVGQFLEFSDCLFLLTASNRVLWLFSESERLFLSNKEQQSWL